jgi:hypothetical protein
VTDVGFDFEAIDSTEASETVVLLGAGASADAGLPIAAQLHERIAERLPDELVPLYRNIADLIFRPRAVDVERLFRVIQFINTVETRNRPHETRLLHESLDIADLVEFWKEPLQTYFNNQRHTTQGTRTGLLIDALLTALWDILWLPWDQTRDLRYLQYLLMSMRGGTIVSLNYDNALEQASLTMSNVQLDAGPYPRTSLPAPSWDAENIVRLIKLHGSLGWIMDPATGDVTELDDNDLLRFRTFNQMINGRPDLPGVIFGAGNKLRAQGPYLDLYVEFKQALARARRLIVIGYGWMDEHVNEVIRRWVREPADRLFRVSSLTSTELPQEQRLWVGSSVKVVVQPIVGPAGVTMPDLMEASSPLER